MSLLVWLPLDGNLDNQGISNVNVTNTNATVNTAGKIGSCYAFNGSNAKITIANLPNPENISIAMWFKRGATTNTRQFLFTAWQGITLELDTSNKVTCSVYSNNKQTGFCNGPELTIESGWTHICFTFEKGIGTKLYINGTLYTSTALTTPIIWNKTSGDIGYYSTYLNGFVNDFRLYNHCLSATEVHEISQGLVLHYKLDKLNNNILSSVPKAYDNTAYQAYQLSLVENLVGGQQYTFQFWDVNVSHSAKTEEQIGIGVYWGGGYNGLKTLLGTSYFPNGHADYISFTITAPTSPARPAEAENLWLCIYNSPSNASGTRNMSIGAWKVEEGNIATPWCYSANEGGNIIYDSSGYNHNGDIINAPNSIISNGRYNIAVHFNGSNQYIRAYRGGMVTDEITVNIWMNKDTWNDTNVRPVSCTQSGGWNFESSNGYIQFPVGTGTSSNTYKNAVSSVKWSDLSTGWHMLTGTYDGFNSKIYIDGVLTGTLSAYTTKTPIFYHASNGIFLAAEAAGNTDTPAGTYCACALSDFRIYATALSAEDIKALYEVSAKIDNKSNIHAYEYLEDTKESFNKSGIISTHQCSEFFPNLHYDKIIYKEPDGSLWIHIAHHNNPGAIRFASTDAFATGAYVNEDCWYDIEQNAINLSAYEFMVQQALTAGATNTKYRWIQSVSPVGAVYDDVKSAAVTRITTSGYTDGTFGGIFIGGHASTRARIANASSGNWYGSFGSWTLYQNGTPGYPNTVVTTGYMDLYLRIDNLDLNMGAKILKNSGINANTLIEF